MSEEKEAEYVRIPFANNSLYPIRAGIDEKAFIMLNEILSIRSIYVIHNRHISGLASDLGKFLETQTQIPEHLKHLQTVG